MFMTSVINGLPMSGANRYSAAGKSPLTGGFGEAEAGGYWGPELKRTRLRRRHRARACRQAGLPDRVGRRSASSATPASTGASFPARCRTGFSDELGDSRIRVLQTGVAGENQVLYSAIVNELRHFHGRAGLGAVMGSKNLKAIVARGRERLGTGRARRRQGSRAAGSATTMTKRTTACTCTARPAASWAWRRTASCPRATSATVRSSTRNAIAGTTMSDTILVNRGTCYSCLVACKREVEVEERGVTPKYGGMEYEIIGALGSLCGVGNMDDVAELSQWVNQYVLDGISTGVSIAFAMECYENGILTKDDTDGLDLTWGNAEASIEMVHKIGRREGFGDVLADGVQRAAQKIGKGSEQYALHVKGQELPMHEPRGKTSLTLAYSVSPTGADHMEAIHDPAWEGPGRGRQRPERGRPD